MSEWQPIETAPKDGTNILIYGVGPVPFITDAVWNNGFWSLFDPYSDAHNMPITHGVTHWMPLPPPPEPKQ